MLGYSLMAFEKVAGAEDLPPGEMRELMRSGQPLVLCHTPDGLHVMEGTCPHAGGRLAQGALHGSTLVCPWHAWEFDCTTGELDFHDSVKLRKFPVERRDDGIYVDFG